MKASAPKTLLSLSLSAALVALSAGLAPYEALAQQFRAVPVSAPVSFGALPLGALPGGNIAPGSLGGLAPMGSLGSAGSLEALASGALQTVPARAADQSGAQVSPFEGSSLENGAGASARRSKDDEDTSSVTRSLAKPLPEFSKMSASQARPASEADFYARLGSKVRSASTVQAGEAPALGVRLSAVEGLFAAKDKGSKKGMPDQSPRVNDDGPDSRGDDRRQGGGGFMEDDGSSSYQGPDDRSEGPSRDGGSSLFTLPRFDLKLSGRQLFAVTAAAGAVLVGAQLVMGATMAAVAAHVGGAALTWAFAVLPSLTLHEYGHAKAADLLGDRTPRFDGRVSLDLRKHVDPLGTIALPLLLMLAPGTSFMFGWAKPVQMNERNFRNPGSDMAKAAFAGPAMNMALALGAAGLYRLAAPMLGVYGLVPSVLGLMVDINLTLALFNLIPIAPFDGHHVFRRVPGLGPLLDKVPARYGMYIAMAAMMLTPLGGLFMGLVGTLHHALLFGGAAVHTAAAAAASVSLASVSAVGLAMGLTGPAPSAPRRLPPQAGIEEAAPLMPSSLAHDYIVELPEGRTLTQDVSLARISANSPDAVVAYGEARAKMLTELSAAGLDAELMARYNAEPLSTFRRVSMATLRVDADKAAAFKAELEAKGYKVHENKRIQLPKPVENTSLWPWTKVSLDELQTIINSTPVHKILEGRFGKPGAPSVRGFASKLARLILGDTPNPEIPVAVIDSGADTTHPHLQKAVKKVVNVTSGENVDDIGHGTHVTDTVRSVDPWQKNITVYKTFEGGSASLDDIMNALTAAGNDGNIIMSNSWGDDEGNPESPESKLVAKLAAEGRIMVFAAGNAGPWANSVGAPAIVTYLSPETGAPRVIAVAAADLNKAIASFSSRGPGSSVTKKTPGYPTRPDITAMGVNLEAAWPKALGKSMNAISGTSMATPNVSGALSLLARAYGVTAVGAALDKIAKAVVDNATDLKKPASDQGKGFMDVFAAYKALEKSGLGGPKLFGSGWLARLASRIVRIFGA